MFSPFLFLSTFKTRVKVASSQLTALLFFPLSGLFCKVTLRVGNSLSLMTIFGRWRRPRSSTVKPVVSNDTTVGF